MPDKPPPETAGAESADLIKIEQGIDAVNILRIEMRKAGLNACVDALDRAFAHCLSDLLILKGMPPAEEETTPKDPG
jgi:hypothetical protein